MADSGNNHYAKDYEDEERSLTNYKWLVFIHDVITFFIGMATFSICMWIRFDLDFAEWIVEIDWYTYWYCMYVVLFAMLFVIANSIIGVFGVVQV